MVYHCTIEKEGDEYIARFPDISNITTRGFTHEEALAMAKEALDRCIEFDIFHGTQIPPPAFSGGHPIPVASHIAICHRLRELRGVQSKVDVAHQVGLSFPVYDALENPRKFNPTIRALEKVARFYGRQLNISF